MEYKDLSINGLNGLFNDKRAIPADWRFVRHNIGIAINPAMSPLQRIQGVILGYGLGAIALPKTIEYYMPTVVNPPSKEFDMKFKNLIVLFSLFLFSCQYIGAGSLGAWKIKVFPVTNKQMASSIDSLYNEYPQYKIPEKWRYESDYWKRDGFQLSKIMFFYFESGPEEMYFVSFLEPGAVKNREYVRLAIRSIYNEKMGWKEIKKYNDEEKVRIEQRFENEIIPKLEKLTNTKSSNEKTYP